MQRSPVKRAMGAQVLLGPNVNIQRNPLAGRNFESYSEDPYLTGTMGTAWVRGVQAQGIGTSVKHFVGNEQELERMRVNSLIDERTLREIYLLPFELIVKQAHPWTVMASYNRLNGTYMTENGELIGAVLKGEWGFDGVLMSDWGAVHSTVAAATAGVDLEMPGPASYFGTRLQDAVRNGQVRPNVIDDAARRVIRTILRSGLLDGDPPPAGEWRSERNKRAALTAARESIVLLKNEGAILPLAREQIHSLAVIGPNADVPFYGGGGSAHVVSSETLTPLESLRRLAGRHVPIHFERGVDIDEVPPPADARLLSPTAARARPGLAFRYFPNTRWSGTSVQRGVETDFDQLFIASQWPEVSARWDGFLWAPETGRYQFSLSGLGAATLQIDDREAIGATHGRLSASRINFGENLKLADLELEGGHRYRIRVEYVGDSSSHSLRLGLRVPAPSFEQAVAAARAAEAAIVFVGSSRTTETEGWDRESLELSGRQNELVRAVRQVNARTIVVLQSGAPYELPWAEQVPAILEAWLNGEEGPHALAEVVWGEINPSGKLPVTFPRKLSDTPTYLYYPESREATYGEGVFVGYRYYDRRDLEVRYPFGHGLSYTTFTYSNLQVPSQWKGNEPAAVTVQVRNTGSRAGQEIVQLYISGGPTPAVVRPVKELKGFTKIRLEPGMSRTVSFALSPRDLSYYDVHEHAWVTMPGTRRVFIGRSSREVPLVKELEWVP